MVMRRKHVLRKSVFRSIRKSVGRYLAIVGIIALGAGFFTGLRVTNTSMMKTGAQYLSETNFYDFRLLNTYGWTEESVSALGSVNRVSSVEGSISTDVLAIYEGKESVLHAMSIGTEINLPQLVTGRMPEKADECLLDSYQFGNIPLGGTITIADTNTEDTASLFAYKTYTIVGTARSPLFINYERGNTTLGNGSVNGFFMIPRDGFDSDYDTEIYLCLEEPGEIYSDAYSATIDALTNPITDAAEAAAMTRYENIVSDAKAELAKATSEYEDGHKEYLDGKSEYEDGLVEYENALNEFNEKKDSTYRTISSNLSKIKSTREELNGQKESVSSTIETLEASIPQLEEAVASLSAQRAAIEADESLPEAQKQATLAQIDAQLDTLSSQLSQAQSGLSQAQAGLAQIEDGLSQCESGRKKILYAKSVADREFDDAQAELDNALTDLEDARLELEDAERELNDAQKELNDAQKEIEDLEKPAVFVLGRDTNVGYVCFDNDAQIVNGISLVFPFFFFAVAALVCVTTMTRMVTDERGQIGTLKALGYTPGSIMAGYLFYSGSAALLGSIIGTIAGSYVFPKVIWTAYSIMYAMPTNLTVFDQGLILLSCVSYVGLSVAVTYFSCRVELHETAAELIRPKSPPPGKRILLERIGFIWKRLSFLRKVSLRNVFRYEKRLFMMILGIGGCMALLLTGLSLNDSITSLGEQQFGHISTYDAAVTFSEDMTPYREEFLSSCGEYAKQAALLYSAAVDCTTSAHTGSVNLMAVDDFDSLTGLMDFHKNSVTVPAPLEGCCIISENLANRYGLSIGDTITLTRNDTEHLSMQVSGIFENVIYNYVYTTTKTVSDAGWETPLKLAYLNIPDSFDIHEAGAHIGGINRVAAITLTVDMLSRVNSMLSSMKYVVLLVIACAASLDFIVLFNLTNINILERIREIATLKVLGFYRTETSQYIMRENIVLTLCGAVAGTPMGILLSRFVISQIKLDMIAFHAKIEPVSYLYAILLTFLFTFLVNLLMQPKLGRINMTEALKSVE